MKTTKNILSLILLITVLTFTSCKSDVADLIDDDTDQCMDNLNLHPTVYDGRHLFFLNENEGWMIGKNSGTIQDTFANHAKLLHTTNGGQTWDVVNNDLGFDAFSMYANGSQFKFQFTNSNHGYMSLDFPMDGYTDQLYYYTNDGGVSWSPVPLPELTNDETIYLYGMGVNSTKMVFASLVVNANSDIPSCYRLYFVSNTTHTITNNIDIECFLLEDHKNYRPREIHITNSGKINMEATSSNPNKKYIAHSENYGASWTYTEVENLPYDHSYMQFANDNVGYMAVNTEVLSETVPFYKTTDGGVTWIKKEAQVDNGTSFYKFSFTDENNGLAIRFADNALYKTTDGGDSWKRVTCFDDTNYSLDIYANPQNIAYLSVDNGIVLTNWMDINETEAENVYQTRVYFYKGE